MHSCTECYPIYKIKKENKDLILKKPDSFPSFSNGMVVSQSHRSCQCCMYNSTHLKFCILVSIEMFSSCVLDIFRKHPSKSLDLSNQVSVEACNKTLCYNFIFFPHFRRIKYSYFLPVCFQFIVENYLFKSF